MPDSLTAHEHLVNGHNGQGPKHHWLLPQWHLVALHVQQPGPVGLCVLVEAHNKVLVSCKGQSKGWTK